MEAIAAYFQTGVVFLGNAVQIRLLGHGLMERGIKYRHIGGIGHNLLAGPDAHQVGGVVKRAKGNIFFHSGNHRVIDQNGA